MTDIPSNLLSEKNNTSKCCGGTKEEMEHVYYCEYLNKEKTEVRYEEMYGENINEIKLILRRFERNLAGTRKKARLAKRSLNVIHLCLYP